MQIQKIIVIFGTFDNVHEGHRDLFMQAKKHGDILIAIVARDNSVLKLKNKIPMFNEEQRIKNLLEIDEIDRVLLGDEEQGTYKILKEINPSVIFLGYDQVALKNDLEKAIEEKNIEKVEILIGQPYQQERFHSSILNSKSVL